MPLSEDRSYHLMQTTRLWYLCMLKLKTMSSTRIALVTGGSRGLGKDMAISIAKKGMDVILTYRSKKEEADETLKQIEALGQQAAALQLDMKNISSLDAFVSEVKTVLNSKWKTSSLDFLIN